MTVEGIRDAYQGRFFYITIANFGIADVYLPGQQKLREVASTPEEIVYIEYKRFSQPFGAKGTESESSVNAVYYRPTPDRLEQTDKHKAVKEREGAILKKVCREDVQLPAKSKDHRPAFLKTLGNLRAFATNTLGVLTYQSTE